MTLEGKTALVIGGGPVINQAICLALAKQGVRLAIVNSESAEETIELIKQNGSQGIILTIDASDSSQVKKMFTRVIDNFSSLDFLVHALSMNYSITRPGFSITGTSQMTDNEWHRILSGFLNGAFYCTRESLRIMGDSGYGRIIYILSDNDVRGTTKHTAVSAATCGIIALMCSLARPAFLRGININAITPVFSPQSLQNTTTLPQEIQEHLYESLKVLGGKGKMEGIASLVQYLLSDEAKILIGQIISPGHLGSRLPQ